MLKIFLEINLPFLKGSTPKTVETAPTETPLPPEVPTPDPVAPTETPTPADATPKKTGTYKAPATQPKNTNRSKLYKGISAVVLGLQYVYYLSILLLCYQLKRS